MTGGIESVDEQLTAAIERRDRALDLLVRSLIEIDTLTTRIDELLERKTAAT
jgi:hypothetical protein